MSLDRREIVSLDIAAPLTQVWAYLRDPHLARRWLGWDRPGLDARIHRVLVETPDERLDVLGLATVHSLVWPHADELRARAVADEPGRTHLTITRRSHEGLLDAYDGVRDVHDEDWVTGAHQLKFALEQYPGVDRRMLCVVGVDAGTRQDRLIDHIGLHGVHGIPVGGNVQAVRPDGSMLGGTLLYRTEFQLGLHLHGAVPSLLVVREEPAASQPPNGTLSVGLSTYGLSAEQWSDVQRRWVEWWAGTPAARQTLEVTRLATQREQPELVHHGHARHARR